MVVPHGCLLLVLLHTRHGYASYVNKDLFLFCYLGSSAFQFSGLLHP
jgi:hypothetical protein